MEIIMKTTFCSSELSYPPLVERKIVLDENIVLIEFSIISDLDFDITFKKEYSSKQNAIKSLDNFIENNKDNKKIETDFSFDVQVKKSKRLLIELLLHGKLALPDDGESYLYVGDIEYLKEIASEQQY